MDKNKKNSSTNKYLISIQDNFYSLLRNHSKVININLFVPLRNLFILIISTILLYLVCWTLTFIPSVELFLSERAITHYQLISIGNDRGYFETFGHIILFWNFLLSFYLVLRLRLLAAFSIPTINLFLLLIDVFRIHNKVYSQKNFYILDTLQLKNNFEIIFGSEVLSELNFLLIFMLLILILISPIFISKNKKSRYFLKINFINYSILGFFAVIVDVFNSTIYRLIDFNKLLDKFIFNMFFLIEELGEMFIISLIFIWLFGLSCSINKFNLYNKSAATK